MTMTQQLSKPQPIKQIAKRVVNECLRVQPDEQVTVFSWDHTLDYASSVAFEVEQAGGIATTILQMNDLYWRYLKEVPEAQYARRQKGFLSLLDQTDAWVQLGGPKDPSVYPTVPDERMGKMIEGGKAMGDKFLERGIRVLNLPIGLVTPDEASAEGIVRFDQPTALAGKMLAGLQLKFENGRITNYAAQSNLDAFKGMYEKMSGDKDRLANIVIGLNPRAELIGFFTDRIVQGTVSVGIGGNKGIGGTNDTQFGHEETLRKPTLVVDSYKLVDEGKIQA